MGYRSRRNQGGTADHRLRQYLLQNSCRIRPLQRLNTLHKLPDQRTLRLRIQHGKEKHQGRCGSRVSPSLQITVRTAGDTKLLRHRFLRKRHCFETKIRDKDALVRDELEFVLGGKDADLIYKHLNREAYAEDVLKQYGAELTPYGMVNREDFGPLHEPIPEQQQEQTQEPQMGM